MTDENRHSFGSISNEIGWAASLSADKAGIFKRQGLQGSFLDQFKMNSLPCTWGQNFGEVGISEAIDNLLKKDERIRTMLILHL